MSMFDRLEDTLRRYEDVTAELGNPDIVTDQDKFRKYMKEQSNIINIASSAAYLPQPSFAVYAATKSMVRSFSKALNKELEDRGITVTAVCPGPVNTEFFDVAEKYSHTKAFKRLFRVEAKNVVKRALFDAYYLKTESTYSITMKAFKIVIKLLPNDWIVSMIK